MRCTMPKGKPKQAKEGAAPQKLEDLDAEKHSAKQMSVVIAKHMQLGDAMALAPAEVVKLAKERLRNGDEPASPVAKPGKGEVKRQLIEIRDALLAADKVQPAPEVSPVQKEKKAQEPADVVGFTKPSVVQGTKDPPPLKPQVATAAQVDESVEIGAASARPAATEAGADESAPNPEAEPEAEPEPVPEPEPEPEPEPAKEKPSAEERFGNPTWIPDDDFPACMVCDESFWLFKRRHHCRACGWLVCDACSEGRKELPKIVSDTDGTIDGEAGKKYRVCKECEGR